MKFCPNCGNPVKENQKFCPECGSSLKEDDVNTVSTPDESIETPTTPLPPLKKKHAPLSIIAFILSLTLLLSPLGVLLAIIDLLKNKGKKHGFSIAALIIGGLLSRLLFRSIRGVSSQRAESSSTHVVATESQKPKATTTETKSSQKINATPSPKIDPKEAFISSCSTVLYQDVERSPDSFKGKNIRIEGNVIQVSEGWLDSVTYRIATNGSNSDIWYVTYTRPSNEIRILNGDHVVIFGICDGVETYKSVLGSTVTIPALKAKYIEVTSLSLAEPKYTTSIVKFDVSKKSYGNNYQYYGIVEIKNIGDCGIHISDSSFDLEDNSGHLLQTEDMWVYSYREIIQPGEVGYIYTSMPIEIKNDTNIENLVLVPKFKAEASFVEPIKYDVSDTSISKAKYGGVSVIGRITNNTSKDKSYLYINVAYFDAEGKVLGISGTSITGLDAGKTVSFEISGSFMNSDFSVADVVSYEVLAED